jgi:hypothetical protein
VKAGKKAKGRTGVLDLADSADFQGEINCREAGFRARVAKISFGNGFGRQPARLDEFHGLDLELLAKR